MHRPLCLQTYQELKLHFTMAYTELRATDAAEDELGDHSASAMVAQIIEKLRVTGIQDPIQEAPQE